MPHPVHVFKFGGTSVATPDRIRRVVGLVQAEPDHAQRIVVVSAFGGVTDQLIQAIDAALARTGTHGATLDALRQRHDDAIEALALDAEKDALRQALATHWHHLGELLDGISLLRECTLRTRDAIIGMGERASAPIVAAAFRAAGTAALAHDATDFIRTDDTFGEGKVRFEESNALIQFHFQNTPADHVAVVTGFIAATERGVVTTLGRSGSDYTATIIAGALQAERAVIWTDVDGVLSADPRLVPDAFTLPDLSYREAGEMAYFGAKVLHPRTMRPLQEQRIPLFIKNTLNPEAPGTRITEASRETEGHVKAVSAIRGVAVVMLEGAGMIGVPGISARTFGALAQHDINVLMISQASSEQSICIVVREAEADDAVAALEGVFEVELARRDVSRIYAVPGCAVVSVVGDYMRMQPGLAGRMFSTLGRSGINVLAIAQGASETNISAVVEDADGARAIRALHEAFARVHDTANLFLIGPGTVGKALLGLLDAHTSALLEGRDLNLRLVGVARSTRAVFDAEGIAPAAALTHLDGSTLTLDDALQAFADSHLERRIIIDATASPDVARRYPAWLGQGLSVVTPNKRGNTFDQAFYDDLKRRTRHGGVCYRYETTVGAALPLLSTLEDLRASGDRIRSIEGVLSGTLAYVFSRLAHGATFSEAVHDARQQGFTEPDPRDDLQGEDVARKLLILAREAGHKVERGDITVDSLVPEHLTRASVDDFMAALGDVDADWQARVASAHREGRRLQYLARLDGDGLRVGIEAVDPESPFAHLRGTDNMVVFTTDRYHTNPLVITGAGAGPEITAAGVLTDLIKAAR